MRRTALALAVLALAGCGDGDEAKRAAPGGDPLSRQEFVRRADAICTRYQEKIGALERPSASSESIVRFMDQVIPLVKQGIREERRLRPPKRYQGTWNEVLAANEELVRTAERLRRAAKRNDPLGVRAEFEKLTEGDEETDRLARRLGLKACSTD